MLFYMYEVSRLDAVETSSVNNASVHELISHTMIIIVCLNLSLSTIN